MIQRNNTYFLILTSVLSGMVAVVSYVSAITTTLIPGVAVLYPAAALEVVCGVWFGLWGGVAAYLGVLIAGIAAGWFSPQLGLVLGIGDFVLAVIPGLMFRLFSFNMELARVKDIIALLSSAMLASILGSLFYNGINLWIGVLQNSRAFWLGVLGWNIGNFVVVTILSIPLLRLLSNLLDRSGFVVKGMLR